jgi:type I restriction enzyme S subunit
MNTVKFENLFQFQKKSKIKAGNGLKLGEAKYPFYTSSGILTKSINEYLFDVESLIFGTGGLASIHFCSEKFAVSTDCFVTQPKDINVVYSKYVYYYLSGNIYILENGFKGAGLKHISKDYLANLLIPLPPLEDQKKIAAILDAADVYRQKTKALIAKYDELTQSLFLDMFGDPVKNEKGWAKDTLGNFCKKIQIGPFGSQLHMSEYVKEGIPLINPTNINNGIIEYSTSVKITENKYNSLPNYHLFKGDIVMARRGDLSKIGIVDSAKSFCGTGSLFLRLKDDFNSVFGFWLLSHRSTVEKLYEQAQGVTMANLNKGIINRLPIVIPPISFQNQFAERVQSIELQKSKAQASLVKADELFNSLLQRAFKGELV